MVWYFFVETKGYTLEEIKIVLETPGLTWKQRRNMKGTGNFVDQSKALAEVEKPVANIEAGESPGQKSNAVASMTTMD